MPKINKFDVPHRESYVPAEEYNVIEEERYRSIHMSRDLATVVHYEAQHQLYVNPYLIMLAIAHCV